MPFDPDACWSWTGATSAGYGVFWAGGRKVGAHVFSHILHIGPVPDGLWVLHTCDNPPCCNPKHLYAGTPRQNSHDRDARGRANTPTGDRNGARRHPDKVPCGEAKRAQAKLTWSKAAEIRRLLGDGTPQIQIARQFGVDPSLISRIKSGRNWPLRGGERLW